MAQFTQNSLIDLEERWRKNEKPWLETLSKSRLSLMPRKEFEEFQKN